MNFSSALIQKYNVPGPRYTSYPTVPNWGGTIHATQWIEAVSQQLQKADANNTGASIYIHIPFCESLCTYCGCNTRITRKKQAGAPYVRTVIQEWKNLIERLHLQSIPVAEIHLGGGTPTFLSSDELHELVESILELTHSTRDGEVPEFSLEVDPRVTQEDQLTTLRKLGFNRISLGVQDFDPKVQMAVNREQSPEDVLRIVECSRQMGFNSVNYDLIYGLPFQSPASIEKTFSIVEQHRPDRIAFYSYAHVPWIKPSHRRWKEQDLPQGPEKRTLYEMGRQLLLRAGYQEMGMDHFAVPEDGLWKAFEKKTLHRNFMGYVARNTSPLIGLGVSAIGDAWNLFSQNEKVLEKYVTRVEAGEMPIFRGHVLSVRDLMIRKHILKLMTRFETSWSASKNVPFLEELPLRLKEPLEDGLVELNEKSCRVMKRGRPFLRNICMAFDPQIPSDALVAPPTSHRKSSISVPSRPRVFSQTI